jgi:SAM-dependent methyltransferase
MAELFREDPTGRFSGLADVYARCRPDYPPEAVRFILQRCGLGPGSVLVDVGAGTGISSRLFARQGLRVLGVEPNADMRARAAAEPGDGPGPAPAYHDGTAEATGLPGASADAVLAAQAFHWFEPATALREFRRVLRPGGWAILMWNERDEGDPLTAAYGAVLRRTAEAGKVEAARGRAGEALLHAPGFEDGRRDTFRHEQPLTEDGLLGRAFSASYAPRTPEAAGRAAADLRELFARQQRGGQVVLRYETSVYTARRGSL